MQRVSSGSMAAANRTVCYKCCDELLATFSLEVYLHEWMAGAPTLTGAPTMNGKRGPEEQQ